MRKLYLACAPSFGKFLAIFYAVGKKKTRHSVYFYFFIYVDYFTQDHSVHITNVIE